MMGSGVRILMRLQCARGKRQEWGQQKSKQGKSEMQDFQQGKDKEQRREKAAESSGNTAGSELS